jgi:hypothetical protein
MLSVVDCLDDASLASCAAISTAPRWSSTWLRRCASCSRAAPSATLVLFSFSHVANDGIGCHRLVQAVARAYRGADEPRDAVELDEARRLGHLRARTWGARAARAREAIRLGLLARNAPPGSQQTAAAGAPATGSSRAR